jgi:hypothetical protein
MFDEILGFCEEKRFKFQAAKDKYKVKVEILLEGEEPIEITVKILKAAASKYCVEFSRNGGDQLLFFT